MFYCNENVIFQNVALLNYFLCEHNVIFVLHIKSTIQAVFTYMSKIYSSLPLKVKVKILQVVSGGREQRLLCILQFL